MYTKFNHRPEQKFAFPRKPKILTMTKSGMDQLIRLTSNPVEFEEEEFKPMFMVKRYPSQITLQEKYSQVEKELDSNLEFQEYYKEPKETQSLENHPDPIMTPYSLKLPPLYQYKPIQLKEPSISDRAIFQGAKYMFEKRKQNRLKPLFQ
ncbi:hypothetical protein pb186bvf_011292 [Paramecium bursaria]